MRKPLLLLTLTLLITSISLLKAENATTNKDGVISSIRGRISLPKYGDFTLSLDQEIRSTTDFGVIKDSRTSLVALYDPTPWFRVGGGYTFMVKEGEDKALLCHRSILFFKQMWKFGYFGVRLRERIESTFENGYLFGDNESDPVNMLRVRFKVNFDNGRNKLVPYIYTELYNHINDDMMLRRVRNQAGVEYKLSKQSKLTGFYQYIQFTNTTSLAPHTIGVLYSYSLLK